ncbi:OmpG porin family protein [Moellerella wisconsensis]|uniref:Uncharacterized protein n=2 Tax=Moellerella wisconsensis TaxID=158849 RepID=A0ACD3Y526_9GAMM|nr:OmpG porin family protein [Moellerella wisconsensis]KLN96985.1 hypothetical protein VK86_07220 [Moellerella wisconsensis]UNH23462.1 hypothetical protein MNY68_11610 [Moellerella wisconsensis]UNH26542.1 hypothetical protein MNY64_11845 [Moellerella wisconsensis]UNH29958.1 hypothetical protein MNY72_11415 [Moellerella wisconsensis]UNH38183.1 hypothetical protein MNY70_11915 [Moellerella wisconsensis]
MKKLGVAVLLPLFSLGLSSFNANAANVNAMLSWESADYETSNNYSGYRVDVNINPDKSNWYFDAGFRQRKHDNDNRFQRYDLQGSYRFKLNNGWIQPGLKVRQDLTNFQNGNRTTVDFYESKTNYQFPINEKWVLSGSVLFGLQKKEDKRGTNINNTDYLSWEIEPGLRYFITPNINTTVAYFDGGKQATRHDEYDTKETNHNQQIRIYANWNTPIGLVISPSMRRSILGKIDDRTNKGERIEKDMTRYTLQLGYQINNQWRVMTEYYNEKVDNKNNGTSSTQDYFKVAIRTTF